MAKQLDENTSMGIDIDGDGKSDFSLKPSKNASLIDFPSSRAFILAFSASINELSPQEKRLN